MTMPSEFLQNAPTRPQGCSFPSGQNAEDIALRFDRLEQRLALLEQMLGARLDASGDPQDIAGRVAPEPSFDAAPLAPAASHPILAPATCPQEDDAELDASVRDYVARLLRKDNANPMPASQECEPPTDPSAVRESSGTRFQQAAAEVSPLPPNRRCADEPPESIESENTPALSREPSDPRRLRLPPERETNLDALREVANLSATAAIRTFERSQAVRKTADRLPLLLIGLACGLMLLYSALTSGQTTLFVGAAAAFGGAVLAASQLLVILSRWLAASQPLEPR
jgi:hypothetical protein